MKQRTIDQIITIGCLFLLGGIGIQSCQTPSCETKNQYATIDVELRVERLEGEIKTLESIDQVIDYLSLHPMLAENFWQASQYPNDTILAKRLFRMLQEPSIDTLFQEKEAYFKDFDENIDQLEGGFRWIKYHYPQATIPKIQTVITGFYNDMYISDSLIILGLDYFAGLTGKYQPIGVPNYIASRFSKESLAPIVLSFVSNEYNRPDQSHGTLLADMVNLGKSYYFVEQAMPCTADSLIIGYTAKEMQAVRKNQEVIWANFIENELLYETSHFLKNKFVGERPSVAEISENCPGRIGAWIGWQIVRNYMSRNPDVSLQELMAETDAHKIFQQSNYKPKNETN